jgi:hypothetical protein
MRGIWRPVIVIVLLVACVAASSDAGSSGRSRRAAETYSRSARLDVELYTARCESRELDHNGGLGADIWPWETVRFPTRTGERWANFAVADALPGQSVIGVVRGGGEYRVFCGRTVRRVRILGGAPVDVLLVTGSSEAGPSIVTSGTVRATFSR